VTGLAATPNAFGCYDPQCGDSTWDHPCPVVPPAVDVVVDHLITCLGVNAAVVVDGDGDPVVAGMLAAGWTLGSTSYVAGKRVRAMTPPATAPERSDGGH
jgi:hypothetical protein